MTFRLRARAVLLTYSQVQDDSSSSFLSPAEAHFNHIANALGTPISYRLGRESHQDGGTHYHAFAAWDKRVSCSNERALDFGGVHPNIQPIPRTPGKSWDYAGKDGDIIHEHGDRPGKSGTVSDGRDRIWGDALLAPDKEGFLSAIRSGAPRDYVLYHEAITRFAESQWTSPPPSYTSPNFLATLPQPIEEWIDQSGLRSGTTPAGRPRSLILHGPTRTGKTIWARSLGKSKMSHSRHYRQSYGRDS